MPTEPWFAREAAIGEDFPSVVVLCCDQLDYTRRCLESVLLHTRPPYELILVDNGSKDGTPAYLKEVCARVGPGQARVIRNDSNRGFGGGCNRPWQSPAAAIWSC